MCILDSLRRVYAKEIDKLWLNLEKLKQSGNTLIIVDHDEQIIRRADQIIDLGPTGGREGGYLQAKFAPDEAAQYSNQSLTAKYLESKRSLSKAGSKSKKYDFLVIQKLGYSI